jgi:hypothetical protein
LQTTTFIFVEYTQQHPFQDEEEQDETRETRLHIRFLYTKINAKNKKIHHKFFFLKNHKFLLTILSMRFFCDSFKKLQNFVFGPHVWGKLGFLGF